MKLSIRAEALFIIETLQEAGFEAYLVGGAVRDLLIADQAQLDSTQTVKDYDLTTDATPEKIQDLFPESYY